MVNRNIEINVLERISYEKERKRKEIEMKLESERKQQVQFSKEEKAMAQ